ncbi:MAG TPA: hypothetical protein VLI07_08375 [Candidatus Binatus sp.]|jgi:hypothetical protein|nr:hypothetical protein [Candidatus Binatus sp.]
MIHTLLPMQYVQQAGARLVEPRKRLMLAVLMSAVSDCQQRMEQRAGAGSSSARRAMVDAVAYVTSTDRSWPFSFENLCEAVGVDAVWLRRKLQDAWVTRSVDASC